MGKVGAKNPKPHTPPQVPEWGKPITSHRIAEGLMIEWTYQSGESSEEREQTLSDFNQAWEYFAAYTERQEKIQAMNIDPELFTECLRDVLTFDE